MSDKIFVFGSNMVGRHGAGAAKFARDNRGAIYGQGVGLQGDSYAIPTKDFTMSPCSLDVVWSHVDEFIEFAREHPDLEFEVTRIGCGLAGYKDEQIAPMFRDAPDNCELPEGWRR